VVMTSFLASTETHQPPYRLVPAEGAGNGDCRQLQAVNPFSATYTHDSRLAAPPSPKPSAHGWHKVAGESGAASYPAVPPRESLMRSKHQQTNGAWGTARTGTCR